MPYLLPRPLLEASIGSAGVLSRRQLRALGATWAYEVAQLDAGRWRAYGPNAVVLHNGPLTRLQSCWVALVNAGEGAALCAATALELDGLEGWLRTPLELVVVKGRLVPPMVGVRVHESRRFDPARDVHPSRLPSRTRPARSAVDAATWSRSPRTAVGWLAASVQQGLTRPEELAAELDSAGRVRHRRLLQHAVADISSGAQALSEIDFARICRRFRLPEPVRQAVRVEASGRRRYLDAEWDLADGRRVVAEVDGAVHLLPRRYWDDMDRANELVIDGSTVLRFATYALRAHPERVADQLRRALRPLPPA